MEWFPEYRIISFEDENFEEAMRQLKATLPKEVAKYLTNILATHPAALESYEGKELGQYKEYTWKVLRISFGFMIVIKHSSGRPMMVTEMVDLENCVLAREIEANEILAEPYTTDPSVLKIMRRNKERGGHWSDGLE